MLACQSGRLKITDFGIAHAAGSVTLTRPGALIGTPAYLAPERAAGAPAAPAADLYALGIVAFQCLTGKLPFSGEPLAVLLAHREQPLPPLPRWVPADVAALVADLTAKDPRDRPASAAEVAERAVRLPAVLTATAIRPRKKQDGHFAWLPVRAALAATAVAAIAAAGWAVTGLHGPASPHQQSSPPAAGRQSSPRGSHPANPGSQPANRVAADRSTGTPSASQAPVPDRRSTALHRSPASKVTTTGTPTSTGTSAPTGTPAPSGSSAPSGTTTPGTSPASSPATAAGSI